MGLYDKLPFETIQALVAANNLSSMSNEFIICLIWHESSFYPNRPHAGGMANGLMAIIKSQAFTQVNIVLSAENKRNKEQRPLYDWKNILDPETNIQIGTKYIRWIEDNYMKNFDSMFKSLYGTGPTYPLDKIYKCEKCLKENKCDNQKCLDAIHLE
jgi:hypothetical protein